MAKPQRTRTEDDPFVQTFQKSVAREISKYPLVKKGRDALFEVQKEQMERLVAIEDETRKALIRDPSGLAAYTSFVEFIQQERRNALAGQPYFREPEAVFIAEIGPAIKEGLVRSLFKFHFNHAFVSYLLRSEVPFAEGCEFLVMAKKLIATRQEIITMNLPLAISRARLFYSRTPRAHLEYLDLVQYAVEGLAAGIDKFRLPFLPVFRSVACSRMSGVFIDAYSATMLRFYPLDKRRIYRANKVMRRVAATDTIDMGTLSEAVNAGVKKVAHVATHQDMTCLMSAAVGTLSLDWQSPGAEDETSFGATIPAEAASRPDVQYEQAETLRSVRSALERLGCIERKIVRMTMGLDEISGG